MDQMVAKPYSYTVQQLFSELNVAENGLSDEEVTKRHSLYGKNILTEKKRESPIKLYFKQFQNTLTLILLLATICMLFIYQFGDHEASDLIEAGLIFAIVILTTILGFVQEYKAEKAIASLKKLLAYKVKVIRDNKEQEVLVESLVPGDIVILEEGGKVPADIRLLSIYSLRVNEASLTGESATVTKKEGVITHDTGIADQYNMVFAGTIIASGRATGVVIRTGDKTEIGTIATSVAETKDDVTPMQKKLDKIGKSIGYIIIGICLIVFLFVMFFANEFAGLPLVTKILQSFIIAVALAVAAIPEGLPAVVTITLALGTQRMAKKNALVRKLTAVETLGATDVICSDKTGTLTKGEMTVTKLFAENQFYEVTGVGYGLTGIITKELTIVAKKLLLCGLLCNNAALAKDGTILGDPTEAALLVSAAKGHIEPLGERVLEIPFRSELKYMAVVIKKEKTYTLFVKGAPEVLIAASAETLTKQQIATYQKAAESMSEESMRVLAFAAKGLSERDFTALKKDEKNILTGITMLGLQGMIDPPREDVKSLIEKCHLSGIRVIMITGDHKATAQAIAQTIGIRGDALSGQELDTLSDNAFQQVIKTTNVYARVSPHFKMRIVDALQKDGHIVAMTGDGVNDAPALKKADIGIAMGITGTDVAKEASDIVLLDDRFATIIAAIEEGRGIYQNIQKFVAYLLRCNISEVLLVFCAILFIQKLPLSAIMLLWINVVTDGLPAVALGLDRVGKNVLLLKPQMFQKDILTRRIWIEMLVFGTLVAVCVLFLFLLTLPEGIRSAQSIAFTAIVVFELVMVYIVRSRYSVPVFSNRWLLTAVIGTAFLQFVIITLPVTQQLFDITGVSGRGGLLIAVFAAWVVIVCLLCNKLFDKFETRT